MSKDEIHLRRRMSKQSQRDERKLYEQSEMLFNDDVLSNYESAFTGNDGVIESDSANLRLSSRNASINTLNENSDAEIFERCHSVLDHSIRQLETIISGDNAFELELRETLRTLDLQLREVKSRCDLLDDRLNDAIETQRRDFETLKSELRSVQDHVMEELRERTNELQDFNNAANTRLDKLKESIGVDLEAQGEPILALATQVRVRLGGPLWRALLQTRLRLFGLALLFLLPVVLVAGSGRLDAFAARASTLSVETSSNFESDEIPSLVES